MVQMRERIPPRGQGLFYYETVEHAAMRLQAIMHRLHRIDVTSLSGGDTGRFSSRGRAAGVRSRGLGATQIVVGTRVGIRPVAVLMGGM